MANNNRTLLIVGLGAAALYILSQRQAAARSALLYPGGAMDPNGFPGGEWWQAPAQQLIDRLVYYPFNSSPDGSPTPQSASQMAWPTSTYA